MTSAPPPAASLDWRPFTDRLARLALLFGLPADWAASLTLPRAVAPVVQSWLRILEATARRLVLELSAQMAAQLGPRQPEPAPRPSVGPAAQLAKGLVPEVYGTDSSRWRGVVFLTSEPERARRSWDAHARWLADASLHARGGGAPALPLAMRYEALRRVARDPERFARRRLRRGPAARPKRVRPHGQVPLRRTAVRPADPGRGPRIRRLDSG